MFTNNKLILFLSIMFLVYLLLYKTKNKNRKLISGSITDNMPEGPEKENEIKKRENMQKKYVNSTPEAPKKNVFENLRLQKRLKKYVNKYGRTFVTFLYLQRLYLPNPIENPLTKHIVWIPLDNDDNVHVRASLFGSPIATSIMIPNSEELEVMTDRMYAHPLPLPNLLMRDINITQLDIFAKWYKKYYIDKKYPTDDSYYYSRISDFIDSL